jgi:Rps23 Pro-64 3,4-dihydroxylase Tpa1-like proline 4-hydroxylase
MFGTTLSNIGVSSVDGRVNFCQQEAAFTFCRNSSFRFGHSATSSHHQDLSRFVSYLTDQELAVTGLDDIARSITKDLFSKDLDIQRSYINVYFPYTPTAVHTDDIESNTVTLLYYANPTWHHDWGGETQFFTKDLTSITDSILPAPGRIAIFDSTIPHTARSPSVLAPTPRFTIAIKGKLK